MNAIVALLGIGLIARTAAAAVPEGSDWPGWRGDGSGISADRFLPLTWDATNHVLWRTPLPGEGSSSPIVSGRRIFITASTDGGSNRLAICLDARDGRMLWQQKLAAGRPPQTDPKAGYAPATPCTDGQRVYVFFDSPGLLAFDMDGHPLWTTPLGPFTSPYNIAASPVFFRDRVIQVCDQGRDAGFIVALDAATGREIWRTPRKLNCQYSSPLLFARRGQWQVVVGGRTVVSYDPLSGAFIWSCAGLTDCVSPTPVLGDDGLVYATSGRNGPSLAIDPSGAGDVRETHMRLQIATGGPYVPSPLFRSVLAIPTDDGVVRLVGTNCPMRVAARLNAHFTASPVLAGNHIYWSAESGDTFVLDASHLGDPEPSLPLTTVNPLREQCLASPAIARGCFYLRTARALYCIAGRQEAVVPSAKPTAAPAATLAELQKRLEEHPAADGPDIPVRLQVVTEMATLRSAEAVDALRFLALKDKHWDVCEAAAKALAAMNLTNATPALLALATDYRDYMKIIAADGLARLRAPEAVPVMLRDIHTLNPLVRMARLQALAEIAVARDTDIGAVRAALQTALVDKEGPIRAAAIRGLARLAAARAGERTAIEPWLGAATDDTNPLVADEARRALRTLATP